MKNPSKPQEDLRKRIIGLGERSFKKSYYPELQHKLADLERFKTLLDQSNDAIFLLQVPGGRFVEVNESACKQMGYDHQEFSNMSIYDIAPEASRQIDELFSGKKGSLMLSAILQTKGGTLIPYEINMRIVDFGGKSYAVAVARDITERKRAEDALKEAKARSELYVDLMGHDINNIDQSALGYLELAKDLLDTKGRLDKSDEMLILTPIENLKASSALIDNVRKLQKEKSGDYQKKPMPLDMVIGEVIGRFRHVPGREVSITFTNRCSCVVMANDLLGDVFTNLIGNSIKHSSGPLDVRVIVECAHVQDQRFCRISVEDNGPGIPDSRKLAIFQRVPGEKGKYAGKGLGLILVKTLIDDYHGRIWVEDRVKGDSGKGSRFIVQLPATVYTQSKVAAQT
jgi:PAS domain S-box-containing protein